MGGSQTPKLPQYETYQKNLEVASKSEHDIQELKKASAFGEAPNKILGGSQQKFGRLPIKFWEAPKKFLGLWIRLWTKNLSLARGLLALQIKIPLGIHFLGP